jgi:hypothetical protein
MHKKTKITNEIMTTIALLKLRYLFLFVRDFKIHVVIIEMNAPTVIST